MKNWTIAKRLVVGFGMVVAITTVLGVFQISTLTKLGGTSKSITEDSLPGVVLFNVIQAAALENTALVMEHTATTDAARFADIERRMSEVSARADKAFKDYEKTIVNARDRELFEDVQKKRSANSAARKEHMTFSRTHDPKETLQRFDTDVRPVHEAYMKAIQAEVDLNQQDAVRAGEQIAGGVTTGTWFTMIGLAFAVLIGSVVAWFIVSTTNKALRTSVAELNEGALQVVSASGQVATSAQSLSMGATEQAASLEETSASMEEMASMTQKNADGAGAASGLMVEVDARVRESNAALRDMVASMASIQESSQQVAKIIKTIDEIAFQTNILALNAAVEAARAGQAGMGFAVVADEVRNLAQRSAKAAKDTAALIEESITKAQSGNHKVEQVAASISGITQSVTKVKGLVEEVSLASAQQAQGVEQVSQAIAQMEKVTQTTAATAEESAAASEELNAQAEGSMAVVARLEALVGGRQAAAKPAKVPAAKASARVVKLTLTGRAKVQSRAAEDELPMGQTGTYGSF